MSPTCSPCSQFLRKLSSTNIIKSYDTSSTSDNLNAGGIVAAYTPATGETRVRFPVGVFDTGQYSIIFWVGF